MVRNSIVWEKLETGKKLIIGLNYHKTLYPSWYYVRRPVHICHKRKEVRRCWRITSGTLKRKERVVDLNWTLYHSLNSSIRSTPKSK